MANASTRRSVSYEKLTEREQYWKETVERLLAQAQETDEQEDQRWGKGLPADALPDALAHAQSRLERLRQAKTELEREAQQRLLPMVESVRQTVGRAPQTVTADAGYWDTTSLSDSGLEGVQVLVPPDANPEPRDAPLPPNAPQTAAAARMGEALGTETGRALYATRKVTVEPVFGQIKEARHSRRFRLKEPENGEP